MQLDKHFSTKGQCDDYIKTHCLDAISMPKYSEDSGELLYWFVNFV